MLLWPEEEDLYTLMAMRSRGGADGLRAREAKRADQSRIVRMARGVFRRLALVRRVAARRAGEDDGARPEQGERCAARRLLGVRDAGRRSARAAVSSKPTWPGGRRRRSSPTAWNSAGGSSPTCSASRRTSFRSCWRASSRRSSARQRRLRRRAVGDREPREQADANPPPRAAACPAGGCDSNRTRRRRGCWSSS